MKVAALVHFSLPDRCAGSEVVLHELMKAAVQAGHEATVFYTNRDAVRTWTGREPVQHLDGVKLVKVRNVILGGQLMARTRPDVVVSHHQHVLHAIRLAKKLGARSVFLTHNDMDLNERPIKLGADLVIHNSEWVRESLGRFGEDKESMVFHPPLTADRHIVDRTGDHVTLVNLNEHKGAKIFYDLATRMPDTKFLGVIGGHGEQIIRRNLPNVTIMEHGPDMKRVWSQTRVLLMPSIYESYGLVAVEAGINGIPTIANPTPGLIENLGPAGLFVDRENTQGWVDEIRRLTKPPRPGFTEGYELASTYARMRAQLALDSTRQTLKQWCDWLG